MYYHRYSTALSHTFLAAVCAYCLRSYAAQHDHYYPVLAYLIVLTNSLCGIWKWGNPANGHTSNVIYNHTRLLQTLFTFPCIVAELWMHEDKNNLWITVAYTHLLCSVMLWMAYYCKLYKESFVDIIIAFNICSCFIISFSIDNWYGVSLAMSYAINHFILRDGCEIFDMPTLDFHNYALCFFLPFSLKALQA